MDNDSFSKVKNFPIQEKSSTGHLEVLRKEVPANS
jgi:hypothetical protein